MSGKVEASIGIENQLLRTGLEESKEMIQDFAHEFTGAIGGLFAAESLIEGARGMMEYGHQVEDLGERFHVSTTALQEWGYAAKQNGLEMDTVAMAFNRMEIGKSKALQGNDKMIEAFAALGVTVQDLRDKSPDEIMKQIGASSMDAADMVEVFGKNGLQLVPMLEKVADGSQTLGDAMDESMIKSLAHANRELDAMTNRLTVVEGKLTANYISPWLDNFLVGLKSAQLGAKSLLTPQLLTPGDDLEAFQRRWDIGIVHPDAPPEDPAKAAAREHAQDKLNLAQELAKIDAEAATKQLTSAEQIAAIQQRQAESKKELDSTEGTEARAAVMHDILNDEKEIGRVKAEASRVQAEADKKAQEARLRAESEYQRIKAENDKREAEVARAAALEAATTPGEKKDLLDQEAAELEGRIAEFKSSIADLETVDDDTGAGKKQVEELRKQMLDAQQALNGIERERKSLNKRPEREPRERDEFTALERIGGRLAGVNYNTPADQHLDGYIKDTAYYTRKIYEKTGTADRAKYRGGY